ncbi:hypothetical protein LT85_p045 (plasmid) [Collimonas arenae]|uniref:Uncharacterized protein n=1 Tax=Collimonas arenae TaxID=279058 RepID=A0A0A1FKL7_9BURK|nr:hypothetical protein [Collimonas arenae]AIY44224.1 hypothetical protein LT85_p045 [Collimonas arenae]
MSNASRPIAPYDFVDRFDRRVLTDDGVPGMDAQAESGSTTELSLASIASVIYAQAKHLNDDQLDEILRWVDMYKSR